MKTWKLKNPHKFWHQLFGTTRRSPEPRLKVKCIFFNPKTRECKQVFCEVEQGKWHIFYKQTSNNCKKLVAEIYSGYVTISSRKQGEMWFAVYGEPPFIFRTDDSIFPINQSPIRH